eukprot:1763677-Amphidinium_carterae.1
MMLMMTMMLIMMVMVKMMVVKKMVKKLVDQEPEHVLKVHKATQSQPAQPLNLGFRVRLLSGRPKKSGLIFNSSCSSIHSLYTPILYGG